MKKRLFLITFMVAILSVLFAFGASAATYYCDKDGNLVDSTSENIAYEFDLSSSRIPNIYLHDTTVTKIVLPDIEEFTGTVQMQSNYDKSLGIYALSDKETKTTDLKAQITEVEIHENIYLDGAYSNGTFEGYTGLQKISFYAKIGVASKAGFFQGCSSLNEVHFYGKDLAVPSAMFGSDLAEAASNAYNRELLIVFHEGSTGTLSTGGDTLPTVSKLGGWKIIINENIKPSNASDTRLGAKWGSVTSTTGWELIMAVDDKSAYTIEQLEALKTSHTFCSRAASLDTAVVKEATVMTYCELGYDEHNNTTEIAYNNGYTESGYKLVGCAKCLKGETEELEALITCDGYSVEEKGTGIVVGYRINDEAIAKYYELTGKTVKYGLYAATKTALNGNDIIGEDGKPTDGAVKAEINNGFIALELKICGITDKEAMFALGAYLEITDENGTEYAYIEDGEPAENEKYCFVSYNSVANK